MIGASGDRIWMDLAVVVASLSSRTGDPKPHSPKSLSVSLSDSHVSVSAKMQESLNSWEYRACACSSSDLFRMDQKSGCKDFHVPLHLRKQRRILVRHTSVRSEIGGNHENASMYIALAKRTRRQQPRI
ncbi:hypothetical protein COCON_G00201260 [Conger conger]|uniref:Uncharacterized protein n=1 Tax=Conger conger TaxID=82655 RepID=A0A9Q1CYT0_CONCO|nr:hypothetical protein COCON_G00201260 [Conger conger]